MEKSIRPVLTVGLPMWNSKDIGWLALESLCNQKIDNFKWELIICQEEIGNFMISDNILSYKKRLFEAGCCNLIYISLKEKITLPNKWKMIGDHMNKRSEIFLLQAADCYSEPERLNTALRLFSENNINWLHSRYGYFYDINQQKISLFDRYLIPGLTSLNMACADYVIKNLPFGYVKSGVDGWMYKTIKTPLVMWDDSDNWKFGIDTHGYNNISKRTDWIKDSTHYFRDAGNIKLDDILPKYICDKLINLKK